MTVEHTAKLELGGFEKKILSYSQAIEAIRESRKRGLKVVLALGVFDVVHIGHLEYLRNARQAGDLLFVGIENDSAIKINKGEARPFNCLADRLEFLSQLQVVDFVFGFEDTPLYDDPKSKEVYVQRYRELNPDAIAVKTWDSSLVSKQIQAKEADVQLLLIDTPRKDSTTRLLKAIGYD